MRRVSKQHAFIWSHEVAFGAGCDRWYQSMDFLGKKMSKGLVV